MKKVFIHGAYLFWRCNLKIIGVTGPTGAGKSLLCRCLEEKKIAYIDADAVYHSLLVPPSDCLNAIRRAFGDKVFSPDGNLDRNKLGKIVFKDKEKLSLLNRTVLGQVLTAIRQKISELDRKGVRVVAVDAPTLIESGFHKECDTVISVIAPPEVRMKRIMARDSIPAQKAAERINAQKSDDFYRENSDYVLENDGDADSFRSAIFCLFDKIGI